MPNKVVRNLSTVHVIRESKRNVRNRFFTCLMDRWSGCGATLDEFQKDESDPQHHKSGLCHNDYAVVMGLIRDRLTTREKAEMAGMIRPRKRDLTKRLLATLEGRKPI